MGIKYRIPLLLFVVLVLVLTSCGGGQAVVEPTVLLSPTVTLTSPPTFTPTVSPTPRLPVSVGTQIPVTGAVLSEDNINQVVELAHWGKGVITGAVYSPDGINIAVASTLGISILQADTLDEIFYFDTNASISSIAYSPDSKTLATGLFDNTVKLWQISDGSLLVSFDSHKSEPASKDAVKDEMTNVAFSPDGKLLAGGSSDNTVSLWQVSDGSLVNTFENHTRDVTSVIFSPDGNTLFSAAGDGKVRMINVSDGKLVNSLAVEFISEMSVSNDGKTLLAIDYSGIDSNFVLWNAEDAKKIKSIPINNLFGSDDITSISLSPDGQFLIAGWDDYTVKIWDLESGAVQTSLDDLRPKDGWYYLSDFTVAFAPDGRSFLMAGSNAIGIWDFNKKTLSASSRLKSQAVYDVALSPDGKILASVEGPNVNLMNISDGTVMATDESIQSNGSIDFDPNGITLAATMFDHSVQVWPVSDDGLRRTYEAGDVQNIWRVDFSPDGKLLALGLESYPSVKIELRQVSDGVLVRTFTPNLRYAYPIEGIFSPDGQLLAGAFGDLIKLYQVLDGKPIRSYDNVYRPMFSPDGTLMAAAGTADNSLKVWKIPSGDSLYSIKDRPESIISLAFSPNGAMLAAGGVDGTIEIFLMSDGGLLTSWKGHSRGVSDLIFTSDGLQLISSSYDGTIRVWGIKP